MKRSLVAAALTLAVSTGAAQAQTLYNNGPVVNGSGLSLLTSPAIVYGFTSNAAAATSVADNFTVAGANWNVSSLSFYGYQTQSGTGVYTFTSATWSVIAGTNINTGATVASGTTLLTNGGLVGYRAADTTPTNQNRAIFKLDADVIDFNLAAGSYFLTWSLAGTGTAGPFVPPVVGSLGSGDALQSVSGAAYATLSDTGSGQTVELPFTIYGTRVAGAVPEPATWAMMLAGFGAVGFALRRRVRASEARFDARIKRISEGAEA